MGILGIAIKVLLKVKSLQTRTANDKVEIHISLLKYMLDENTSILLSVATVVVASLIYEYNLSNFPAAIADLVTKWNIWVFIAIGYMGSDILIKVLGVTEKAANKAVDEALNKIP